jgi:small redox-active disulfide protein 2
MEIKVLGPGCPKCKTLIKNVTDAVSDLGIEANVVKVDDIVDIMAYGVMTTPALVIDGKVVLKGFVPSVTELKSMLAMKKG